MSLTNVQQNVSRFGWSAALYDLGLRAANRLITLKILNGVCIEEATAEFRELAEASAFQRLDAATVRRFAGRTGYELSDEFLDQALGKGDECYGVIDGDVLAAYGWYSSRPTAIEPPDLVLHFDPRYVYMYKGFTHPNFRGRRLHAVGMTYALLVYRAKGSRGILSYVESNNFGSLRSCYRMGYRDVGRVYAVRMFGSYVTRHSKSCERYGFCLKPLTQQVVSGWRAAA